MRSGWHGRSEVTRKTTITLAFLSFSLACGSSTAALQEKSTPPKNPIPAALTSSTQVAEDSSTQRPAYRNAYYIFQTGVVSVCAYCYVPLLITPEPLDDIAKH